MDILGSVCSGTHTGIGCLLRLFGSAMPGAVNTTQTSANLTQGTANASQNSTQLDLAQLFKGVKSAAPAVQSNKKAGR